MDAVIGKGRQYIKKTKMKFLSYGYVSAYSLRKENRNEGQINNMIKFCL